MTNQLNELQQKYPGAQAWSFGDTAELADELAALVLRGEKTGSCGSMAAYQAAPVLPGSRHIILNSHGIPVCVIRLTGLQLIRFCEMTPELAALEGEGDKSLQYWRRAHQAFFSREGGFSDEMELVFERFTVIDKLEEETDR